MTGKRKRATAAALAVAATLATAWLSRVPVAFSEAGDALLRLSWRMDGVTAEACRERTPEELERLAVHMRNPRACIGHIAPYAISLVVDGVEVVVDTAHPAGARGDRPIYVFADAPVAPGALRVAVDVRAILPAGVTPEADAVTRLVWEGSVDVGAREVALITLDGTGRALELRLP